MVSLSQYFCHLYQDSFPIIFWPTSKLKKLSPNFYLAADRPLASFATHSWHSMLGSTSCNPYQGWCLSLSLSPSYRFLLMACNGLGTVNGTRALVLSLCDVITIRAYEKVRGYGCWAASATVSRPVEGFWMVSSFKLPCHIVVMSILIECKRIQSLYLFFSLVSLLYPNHSTYSGNQYF